MKVNQRYSNLNNEEIEMTSPPDQTRLTPQQELDKTKDKFIIFCKWLGGKIESLSWVILGLVILYYSNFFKVLFTNKNVNQPFLIISMVSLGIHISMNIYSTFILPLVFNITEDIEKHNPKIIYVGAFTGFISFVTLIIAVWPVWGFLTIPMIFGMFFGYINSAAFLPGNTIGSILFALVFVAATLSTYLIEHDGLLH